MHLYDFQISQNSSELLHIYFLIRCTYWKNVSVYSSIFLFIFASRVVRSLIYFRFSCFELMCKNLRTRWNQWYSCILHSIKTNKASTIKMLIMVSRPFSNPNPNLFGFIFSNSLNISYEFIYLLFQQKLN